MKSKFLFKIYSFILPAILFPILFQLGKKLELSTLQIFILLSFAVIYAYLIPWFCVHQLKLWSLKGKFKIRLENGLVFGSFSIFIIAANLYNLDFKNIQFIDYLLKGFISFSLLGLWNWLFDSYAVSKGFIKCYNKEYSQGKSPLEITASYGVLVFGTQGAILNTLLIYNINQFLNGSSISIPIYFLQLILYIITPTSLYAIQHRIRFGNYGLKSYYDHKAK